MKRTTGLIAVLLAVLLTSALPAPAQERSKKQTYAPRVIGRAESFIVEGRITAAGPRTISIKTDKGARATFEIDDQTTVLVSNELVSISTMADIELAASDLQVFDRVEIVFQREGPRRLARIITRLQSDRDRVARH